MKNSFLSKSLFVSAITGLLFAGAANAAIISFDDDDMLQTGQLMYGGNDGPLMGMDIDFYSITGTGTPLSNGKTLDCLGCKLNFKTGNLVSSPAGSITGTFTFAAGGSFVLTGDAVHEGETIASGVLLEGAFTEEVFLVSAGAGEDSIFASLIGFGVDDKNDDLVAKFFPAPLPEFFSFANTNISTSGLEQMPGGGFMANVTEADLINVPEPSAAALLALGVAGLALGRRRARK